MIAQMNDIGKKIHTKVASVSLEQGRLQTSLATTR
jgi:hypothetical protein